MFATRMATADDAMRKAAMYPAAITATLRCGFMALVGKRLATPFACRARCKELDV